MLAQVDDGKPDAGRVGQHDESGFAERFPGKEERQERVSGMERWEGGHVVGADAVDVLI